MGKIVDESSTNGFHETNGLKSEKNVMLCQSRNLPFLFSKIRNVETESKDFAFYAMRIMKLIAEDALALITTKGMLPKGRRAMQNRSNRTTSEGICGH